MNHSGTRTKCSVDEETTFVRDFQLNGTASGLKTFCCASENRPALHRIRVTEFQIRRFNEDNKNESNWDGGVV